MEFWLVYSLVLATSPVKNRTASFIALTKPRIIELLLITTLPTMVVADHGIPSISLMISTLVGGALAAGGANAYNMFIDRDIDSLMQRTERRPLVTGEVEPIEALIFATILEITAFLWLWYTVNLLSAVLALSACLFYVLVYSLWLKRKYSQNIVIGGAAGAVPVLVGWAAVTNSLGVVPFILFAIIFFWTPPHFWALAIKYENDYKSASVPMLPLVEGFKLTSLQIIGYAAIVWGLTLIYAVVEPAGYLFLVTANILGFLFLYKAWVLYKQHTVEDRYNQAIKYFRFSIIYLSVLFVVMAIDQLVGWNIW